MDTLPALIRGALAPHADPGYRARVLTLYHAPASSVLGVPLPAVRSVARAHALPRDASADDVLARAAVLCETGTFELKIVAFAWARRSVRRMRPEHFAVLASWLATVVEDWADGDDLCKGVIGPFLLRFPAFLETVRDDWPCAPGPWVRRGAAVSLVPGLRQGRFLDAALVVARRLADDEAPIVKKAVGWLLAEGTKRHPDALAAWLALHEAALPTAAVRRAQQALRRAAHTAGDAG